MKGRVQMRLDLTTQELNTLFEMFGSGLVGFMLARYRRPDATAAPAAPRDSPRPRRRRKRRKRKK
jgi:hypothetical protein